VTSADSWSVHASSQLINLSLGYLPYRAGRELI
jgi:hypothetical protein